MLHPLPRLRWQRIPYCRQCTQTTCPSLPSVLESAGMIRQIATTFSRWTCAASLLAILVAGAVVYAPRAQADEHRWGFGSGLGLTSGTVNGTVFNLAFSGDYYLDRNFSVGPLMQISPTGDLFQISFAGVGRYYFRLNNGINLVPFTGIGLIHADLDRGTGPGSIDRNDTSWYIPIGALTRVPGYPQSRLDVDVDRQSPRHQSFSVAIGE